MECIHENPYTITILMTTFPFLFSAKNYSILGLDDHHNFSPVQLHSFSLHPVDIPAHEKKIQQYYVYKYTFPKDIPNKVQCIAAIMLTNLLIRRFSL
jgi:hypothetical protein